MSQEPVEQRVFWADAWDFPRDDDWLVRSLDFAAGQYGVVQYRGVVGDGPHLRFAAPPWAKRDKVLEIAREVAETWERAQPLRQTGARDRWLLYTKDDALCAADRWDAIWSRYCDDPAILAIKPMTAMNAWSVPKPLGSPGVVIGDETYGAVANDLGHLINDLQQRKLDLQHRIDQTKALLAEMLNQTMEYDEDLNRFAVARDRLRSRAGAPSAPEVGTATEGAEQEGRGQGPAPPS